MLEANYNYIIFNIIFHWIPQVDWIFLHSIFFLDFFLDQGLFGGTTGNPIFQSSSGPPFGF